MAHSNDHSTTFISELTSEPHHNGLSIGTLVGIIAGIATMVFVMTLTLAVPLTYFIFKKQKISSIAMESQSSELKPSDHRFHEQGTYPLFNLFCYYHLP